MVGEAMEARATGSTDIPSTVGGSHIANNINTDEPRHQSASMALSGITASMATATESSQPLHRLLANGAVPTFKGQAQSVIHLPGGGGGDGGAAVAEVSLATRTQYLPIVEAVEVPEGHGETVFALAIANGVGGGGGGFDEGGDPTALVASSADTYNHASLNNSTAASSATNPTKQKDGPEASNSTIRSKKYIWILAVVLGLCIVVGGTVCATGNCSRVEKNRTNESSGDESIFEQRPYFETSVELRQAVDEYVRAKGSDSSGVAVQYGHPMGTWDVSRLFNFSGIFDGTNRYELKSSFDEDLSGWNVSQATDMFKMFAHLDVYSGKGLGTWDVSKVTNMRSMFHEAFMFQGDLSKWDVTSVKSFARLFSDCHLFNSNLADWNTRNALDMGWMVRANDAPSK